MSQQTQLILIVSLLPVFAFVVGFLLARLGGADKSGRRKKEK